VIEKHFTELDLFGSFLVLKFKFHLSSLAGQLRELKHMPASVTEIEREGTHAGLRKFGFLFCGEIALEGDRN
jgi:hypothetical protein